MNRAAHVVAAILAIVPSPGIGQLPRRPPVSVEVGGADALVHRPLVFMAASVGPFFTPDACRPGLFALYEDGLVIYTRATGDCPTLRAQVSTARARELADQLAGGLSRVPYKQWLTGCSDQPSVELEVRSGSRWRSTRVYGLDRFGAITCTVDDDDPPHPNTLAALRAIAAFEAPGAVPWVAEEFAVSLTPAAYYPPEYASRAVPWPNDLPAPSLDSHPTYPVTYYPAQYLEAARRLVSPLGNSFVTVGQTTWAYHLRSAVLPEEAYLTKVDAALHRAEAALQTP